MLLKEIVKYTPQSHSDYQNLGTAVEKIKEVNDFINDKKKNDDNLRKLSEISNTITFEEGQTFVRAPFLFCFF